jgi:hypothetical protein
MADLPPFAVAFIGVAAVIACFYLIWRVILLFAPGWYSAMIKNNAVSVDDFVGGPPDPVSAFKSVLLNWFNVGSRVAKKEGYPLKTAPSDKVPGLIVTSRNESAPQSWSDTTKPPVVVGTIRMGFGHHRIAYAATSWGLGGGGKLFGLVGGGKIDRETW